MSTHANRPGSSPLSSTRGPTLQRLKQRPWTAALLLAMAALSLLATLGGGRVRFAEDVDLVGIALPRAVAPGHTAAITVRLRPHHALAVDERVFLHLESDVADEDANQAARCRTVAEGSPSPPSSRWTDQEVSVEVALPIAADCALSRLAAYAGLYDPRSSARLAIVAPSTVDDRLRVASIDVDPDADEADTSPTFWSARDVRAAAAWALVRPWLAWLVPFFLACGLTATIALRRPASTVDDADPANEATPLSPAERRVALALLAVPFVLGILVVLEFVKDDAYISFRYAHNLVTGHGLVFNPGEKLEGYTNFLWVLILAPFEALGWDLFQVCEVLGTALGITCLVITARMTGWIHDRSKLLSELWGALWLSTSSSFVLWAKSGLEQPLSTLLPIAGAFVLWRARESTLLADGAAARKRVERRYLWAGLIMGAGCMTRPELHLLAILVGIPLLRDMVVQRRVTRAEMFYAVGILAVTVPCHSFRLAYYGTLVPNTFFAKTGTGAGVWRQGLQTLREMFAFNHTGLLAVAAPFAFATRERRVEKTTMAVIALAFMAYYVEVGADEMQWHRLYLPALPFLCVLAALGAQNLVSAGVRAARSRGPLATVVGYALGWSAVFIAGAHNFRFTYREQHGFDGHGDLAGTFHPDLGKFLVRHERPGGLVAFQDMGSTPYHAPDIAFLDFIGLTDGTVAHARHDMGLHAFVGGDSGPARQAYEAKMRDYFFERNPEWTILTIYTPAGQERLLSQEFDRDPTGGSFGDAYRSNPYQFSIWDDERFRQRYVPVRTWPRSSAYYLALWRRRDLWEQTPGEVVLDSPPAPSPGGPKATFEGGLQLLGGELTRETLERHEVFITTWWKLPGPMPHDLMFFAHVTREGHQTPADHVPGDWMYPADRWKAGEILEDRTLFQLPPFVMPPGTYRVFIGVYDRSTGARLAIQGGDSDGENRVLLGSFEAKTLYPLVDQLIPPTRVEKQRRHPERIVDSRR